MSSSADNLFLYAARYLAGRPALLRVELDCVAGNVTVVAGSEKEALQASVELARALALIEKEKPAGGWPVSPMPQQVKREDFALFFEPTLPAGAVRHTTGWRISEGEGEEEENWRMLFALAGACGALGGLAWALEKGQIVPPTVSWIFWILSFVAGAWDAAGDAWKSLRVGRPDIHFLMMLAGGAAMALGLPAEGVTLMFLFTLATALEHYAEHRTRSETDVLLRHAPREARVILSDGSEQVMPASWLVPGEVMNCPPGDGFAADGVVADGNSAVDESSLTGESLPVRKTPGDAVAGGTLNVESALRVRVSRPAADSAAQQIARLVGEARQARGQTQRIAAFFGDRYTWGLLTACVLCVLFWSAQGLPFWQQGGGTGTALYRALALLVAGSPCAIALSAPSALFAAAAGGARQGLLIRNAAALETLSQIKAVAVDKTGTLTTGELGLEQVTTSDSARENEFWLAAAAMASGSSHPVSRAISHLARARGLEVIAAEAARARVGFGVEGSARGMKVRLGSRELLSEVAEEWGLRLPPAETVDVDGLVEVWTASPGWWARFQLRDTMRPEAPSTIAKLRAAGLTVVMLTGDRSAPARAMAVKLGLSDVRSGLKPEGKVAAVGELRRKFGKVAMVGDGLNDAPCLAAADVGVAVGGRASEATLAQSDLVLPEGRFDTFERAWRLSRRTHLVLWQNLALAGTLAATAATASFFGWITLPMAVIAHEGGTVMVCLNSLRLLRKTD